MLMLIQEKLGLLGVGRWGGRR